MRETYEIYIAVKVIKDQCLTSYIPALLVARFGARNRGVERKRFFGKWGH